jgi:hypothetical protein
MISLRCHTRLLNIVPVGIERVFLAHLVPSTLNPMTTQVFANNEMVVANNEMVLANKRRFGCGGRG